MTYGQGINSKLIGAVFAAALLAANLGMAEPTHGIAMYGDPALPHDFVSLPYANPNAPKGGTIVSAEGGTFTSLNPHVRKGSVPWQLRFLAYESLMGRSYDEPFTLYTLLPNRLRPMRAAAGLNFRFIQRRDSLMAAR